MHCTTLDQAQIETFRAAAFIDSWNDMHYNIVDRISIIERVISTFLVRNSFSAHSLSRTKAPWSSPDRSPRVNERLVNVFLEELKTSCFGLSGEGNGTEHKI